MTDTVILTQGWQFGEGPRWRDGRLWFTDQHGRAVHSVSPAGDLRCEFAMDDMPSGLGWMPDGSLLVVAMTRRQVMRRSADGTMTLHADLSGIATGKCNDMVVDAKGGAYVGNFGFDLEGEIVARGMAAVLADHATASLAYVAPDGRARVAAEGMHFPNGSVITPDGKTLIVGETLGGCLTAFDIGADGTLSNRQVWAATAPRAPDGIALDAEGAIWVANPMAPECVRYARGGKVLQVIATDQPCYACALGGADGHTLFMLTADSFMPGEPDAPPTGTLRTARVEVPMA